MFPPLGAKIITEDQPLVAGRSVQLVQLIQLIELLELMQLIELMEWMKVMGKKCPPREYSMGCVSWGSLPPAEISWYRWVAGLGWDVWYGVLWYGTV